VAIARTTTEFALMFLLQARPEAYVFPLLRLGSNLVAGTLSGLVTYFILPAFGGVEPNRAVGGGGAGVAAAETAAGAAASEPHAVLAPPIEAAPAGAEDVALGNPHEVQS
jgi:hypothetical protein